MLSLEGGSLIAGRFRLERMLAKGGMGSIWVARHLQLDVDVAIKFMAPEHAASDEARARFAREAKASAQLRSPNVVQVFDYGVEDGSPYIAMELLQGEDLATRLERERRLSLAATLSVIHQVCKALRLAHDVGLVHRDLKPANIFIVRQGGEEIVKVLDFGIAKATGPILAGEVTRTGTLIGSPCYMSPEQARRSKQVDHRSDIWSLGVIIFQCLTGRLPFAGEDLVDLLMDICSNPILAPSQIAKDLGPEVDSCVGRALARDPAQRFQSAGELADAFAAAVSARGAMSLPSSPALAVSAPALSQSTLAPSGQSVSRAPSRARWPVVLLAAGLGAIAVGVIAFTLLLTPARPASAPPPPSSAPAQAAAPVESVIAAPADTAALAGSQAPPASASASASAPAKPRLPSKSSPAPVVPAPPKPSRRMDDPLKRM